MTPIIALTICFAFVAFGDVLSLKTKAKIPALAASIIAYLIAIWIGMPKDYPDISGMASLGDMLFPVFVAGLATSVVPISMLRNWKFILIGFIGVISALLFTIIVGGFFYDPREMFAGAITTSGAGLTGGLLVIGRLKDIGMVEMLTIPLLLASTIDAIGQPVGSLVMRKYVGNLISNDAYLSDSIFENHINKKLTKHGVSYNSPENPSPWFISWIPPKYETEAVAFMQLAITVALATIIGNATGMGWTLALIILGLLGNLLGFFRLNMLERTKSYGLVMAAIYALLFQMLNDMTLAAILEKFLPLLLTVILSGTGLILGGMFGAKIFGYDPLLGASATIGLFYLFPGVKNIIEEVARSMARNEEEREYIVAKLSPPCIITASMGGKLCLIVGTILIPVIIR